MSNDNLRSKDTFELLLGISEGTIAGLVDGQKSFYYGDTPLKNQSGADNFKKQTLNFYPGSAFDDPVIMTLGGNSNNKVVNVDLSTNTPVTRTTQSGNLNFIDFRIAVQRLCVNGGGGTTPSSVEFKIEIKASSASTWNLVTGQNIILKGQTTSIYVKEFRVAVTPLVSDTYDLRVTKITDPNTTTIFRDINWESYQEIVAINKAFPNTAIIQLYGQSSDQLSTLPQFSGIYLGRVVKIPTNYNPNTRVYTGTWDGSFQIAWTDNPAWVLYDLVMNSRFGIASYYLDVNLDKYDTYDAGKWCDTMVDDGSGGLEPRYTFNGLLDQAQPGKQLARYVAGSFNATFFDDLNGTAYLRVDKDDDPVMILTKEMVVEGLFDYGYTDITSQYNDINVKFINPALNWNEDVRRVFKQALIDKYGRIPLDFVAVGCIHTREALRRAWYKLITATTETCVVTFKLNRLGQFLKPFDVVLICDPDQGWGLSGRIRSLATNRLSVVLRDPIYLEVGLLYNLVITLKDGSKHTTTISPGTTGFVTTLAFNDAVPDQMTGEHAVFKLEQPEALGAARPFRITKCEEVDGSADSFQIEAININRNKWAESDNLTDLGVLEYSSLPSVLNPPGPTSCSFEERFLPDITAFELLVSPVFDHKLYRYYSLNDEFEVWSRPYGTNDDFAKRDLINGYAILNHPPGHYEFKILAIASTGNKTTIEKAPSYDFVLTNPSDRPADVDYLYQNKSEFYWGYANPPADFAGFRLRYQNIQDRETWDDAIQPHTGLLSASHFYTSLVPSSARVVMVKAVDAFGFESLNAKILRLDVVDVIPTFLIQSFDFYTTSPPWQGTLLGCSIDLSDNNYMKADPVGHFYSGIPTAFVYDGGNMYVEVYNELNYIGSFTPTHPGSAVVDVDFDAAGYEVSLRDRSISPPGPWFLMANQPSLNAQTYDVKLRIFGGPVRGVVRDFAIDIDGAKVEEYLTTVAISNTGTRLPIQKAFTAIKVVNVSIEDDGGGAKSFVVFDKAVTIGAGPLVKLYNAAGALVAGHVSVTVVGYA